MPRANLAAVSAMEQGGRALRVAVLIGIVVAVQVQVGLLVAHGSSTTGFGLLAVTIAAVVSLSGPARIGVIVFPAVYMSRRFGAGGLDFSYADVALIGGVAVCAVQVPWTNPVFRRLFLAFAVYMTILAIPLAVNPSKRALLECFHRLFLVVGAVSVGAAVAKAGWTRIALRSYVAASVFVSLAAVQDSLSHDRTPSYVFDINKNAGGFLVVCALVVLLVARPVVRIWAWLTNLCMLALFAGMLAFQSRGAAAALGAVFLLAAVRMKKRNLAVPLAGVVALGAMVRATVETQIERVEETGYQGANSLNSRITTYEEALDLWRANRWFGRGIRFWNDPVIALTYSGGEPHNLFISALGEAGILGAIAVATFIALALWALRGPRTPLWLCARYLVIAQAVAGLADIYWRAGTGTLPWLVVGLAVGSVTAVASEHVGMNGDGQVVRSDQTTSFTSIPV